MREALSGALAWENGPVLAADTVYMRSHEVGQVDRVAFDPATDVVSFKFYGSRENLSMTESPEGVVIADLSTGQKLILLGLTRADLSPTNFAFTFTQVREDDLSASTCRKAQYFSVPEEYAASLPTILPTKRGPLSSAAAAP